MNKKFACVVFLSALVITCSEATASHFALTKIVDASTPRPEGGTFVGTVDNVTHPAPAILESTIAFRYGGSIYTYVNGTITRLYDPAAFTYVPYSANFDEVPMQVIGEGQVAILTWLTNFQSAVYLADASGVRPLVDSSFVLPGTTNRFQSIMSFSAEGTNLVVSSWGYMDSTGGVTISDADGVYLISGTNAQRVIDRTTVVPGSGGGTFAGATHVSYGADRLSMMAVVGYAPSVLVTLQDGVLAKIIAVGDYIPDSNKTFIGFPLIADRKGSLAFLGRDSTLSGSIHRYYDEALTTVASQGQALPDGGGNLDIIGSVAFDGGNVAFDSFKSQPFYSDIAIYASIGDQLMTVLSPAATSLDGHTLASVRLGPHSMSGNTIVFAAEFTDGNSAIYKADLIVDEPIPSVGDYDGDGHADTALFDPEKSLWSSREAKSTFNTKKFGYPGVLPAAGDYDNDGVTDISVYDPSNGNWFLLMSYNGFHASGFGYGGTLPVPADYDGDGATDRAVYDPISGWWFILGTAGEFRSLQFGYYGVQPVPADFDGDGKADIAVYDPAYGLWYILASTDGFSITQFGYPGVTPVTSDFDGQGADLAVFDNRDGNWYSLGQVDGFQLRQFGYPGVRPVSSDYDGDAKSDLGVYDPYRATWYLLRTSAGFRHGGL